MRIRVKKRFELVKEKSGVTQFKYRGADIMRFKTTRWGDKPYYMFTLEGKRYGTFYKQSDVMDRIDDILEGKDRIKNENENKSPS
jgi:hypothetical protein